MPALSLKELYPGNQHVLARYLGNLTSREAAARLQVGRSMIGYLFSGHFDDITRYTVMSGNWAEVLPQIHPEATDGEKQELEAWLRRIIGDCPLALFVGHLKTKETAEKLGIKANALMQILSDGVVPFRHTVMAGRWKEIVPQLHPNVARGLPVPEEDLKKWNAWIDGITGTSPLVPFIGHYQLKQLEDPLGITRMFIGRIINGHEMPSRETVMANKWREVLPTLHPNAALGKPIPEEELKRLNEWLDGIVGNHILYRFIGHMKYDGMSALLGVHHGYLDNILNGTTMASPYALGVNRWREKLLRANPGATAQEIRELDAWLESCWEARTRSASGLREEWKKAVGEVFREIRMHVAPDMETFLDKWKCNTWTERRLKSAYAEMEAGTYGKVNMSEELETYLAVAREVCRIARITPSWAVMMENKTAAYRDKPSILQSGVYKCDKPLFKAYRRLASLFPPLAPRGSKLQDLAA